MHAHVRGDPGAPNVGVEEEYRHEIQHQRADDGEKVEPRPVEGVEADLHGYDDD